jgi:STE24 endopeptidase
MRMANEDKATRYHRLQRRASVAATCAAAALLALLLVSGSAVQLREAVERVTGGGAVRTTALYVLILIALTECLQLPFAYYQGVTLERRYGLAAGPRRRWWMDRAKATVLGAMLALLASLILYGLLWWMPDGWWIAATVILTALLAVMAQIAPVLLLPLFYELKPLDRPELTRRLVDLARRARADVLGVFEWRVGDRTRKANAALAGIGRTRRILVSDTLLADHTDDEIEVILAHELAHHVHRDIWFGLAVEGALIAVGLLAADRALGAGVPLLGLAGKGDPAGLPLLVLTVGAVSLLLAPALHAVSRAHERRADRYALAMTGNADAFISAMRKLASANLAEERPSRLVEVLFHSHPSTSARVAAALEWQSVEADRPP